MSSPQNQPREIYSAGEWKERLRHAVTDNQRVVFVVGSGLSWDGQSGVWGVSEVVKHVGDLCPDIATSGTADGYQTILMKLKGRKGPGAIEQVVRRAVLAAARDCETKQKAFIEIASGTSVLACRTLQADPDAWYLPKGVSALAELIGLLTEKPKVGPPSVYPCILSTNFDGLVEIALARRNIPHESVVVAGDVFPRSLDQKVSVVHLHGFWCEHPTLHSPGALQVDRPRLAHALRSLLDGAQVFVLGYGGWNDIVLDTMSDIFEHQSANHLPALMWALRESEAKVREVECNPKAPVGRVFKAFSSGLALAYSSFYCGVDAHRDLPQAVDDLKNMGETSKVAVIVGSGTEVLAQTVQSPGSATTILGIVKESLASIPTVEGLEILRRPDPGYHAPYDLSLRQVGIGPVEPPPVSGTPAVEDSNLAAIDAATVDGTCRPSKYDHPGAGRDA